LLLSDFNAACRAARAWALAHPHEYALIYGSPVPGYAAPQDTVAGLAIFAATGQPWWLVLALFLAPDLFMLGYLAGPKTGAWIYNLAHSAPLALLAAGLGWHITALAVAGAIGLFHIGLDRAIKAGLKVRPRLRRQPPGRLGEALMVSSRAWRPCCRGIRQRLPCRPGRVVAGRWRVGFAR
jgi:hypothetical protein